MKIKKDSKKWKEIIEKVKDLRKRFDSLKSYRELLRIKWELTIIEEKLGIKY